MKPEIIKTSIDKLPVSEVGKIADDNEIWEMTDGGAHFKVTRHWLSVPGQDDLEIVAFSISGQPDERRRVIDEFKDVFGEPAESSTVPTNPEHVDIVMWLMQTDS